MTTTPSKPTHAAIGTSSGMAVDGAGNVAFDPSKNVLDLVEASIQRLDDIAQKEAAITDAKLNGIQKEINLQVEIAKNRADHNAELGQLRAAHNIEIVNLHAAQQVALDEKESKRLDSVRMVDQLAVKTESDRAATAIAALATTTATMAETLRAAQAASAATLATQFDRSMAQANERIASLEKSSYTGAGKAGVADPQIERLTSMVESLSRSQSQGAGRSEGISSSAKAIIAALGALATLLGLFTFFSARAEPQSPIYTPAPYGTQLPSNPPTPVPR